MLSRISPRTLGIAIGAVAGVVILIALVMSLGEGPVEGSDQYPAGSRVTAVVRVVDAKGSPLDSQPDSFTVTLVRVGEGKPRYGTSAGPGRITFFGLQPGTYVLRPLVPRGEPVRFELGADQQVEKRLVICRGAGC